MAVGHGITSFFAHDVRSAGIESIVKQTLEIVGEGPVFLSIDVDVSFVQADITALVAERIVREVLTGIALRRR